MTTVISDHGSRRVELGFVVFFAGLLGWGLIQPLFGEDLEVSFLLLAGACVLNSAATLPRSARLRYAMMGLSMLLVVVFFTQR